MTVEELQAHLDTLDDGVLRRGAHTPGREFCALEFKSQLDGIPWTDDPVTLAFPDIRPLNDLFVSDLRRTTALLPLMSVLWDWTHWSPTSKQSFVEELAIRTVNLIIAKLPYISAENRKQCENANTLAAAGAAADAARAAAGTAGAAADAARAARAAGAAAGAAYAAARAAGAAADAAHTAADAATRAAADAAADTAARAADTARAANAAARAADAAARAARGAADAADTVTAADSIGDIACQLWVDAARRARATNDHESRMD